MFVLRIPFVLLILLRVPIYQVTHPETLRHKVRRIRERTIHFAVSAGVDVLGIFVRRCDMDALLVHVL